jgi:HEAT repeat protein
MAKVAYLRALGSPDPLPLADQDRLFRWIAEHRIPEASDAVLKRFLNAKIEAERQRAALTLGALGDRRVVPLLLNHLDSGSPPIQAALAEALGRLGDPAAAPSLERLGARTQDPDVASAVQRALARLGAQKAP